MKMNFKFIKCLILVFLISNIFENFGAYCSNTKMSASFQSNYKLMLEKKRGSNDKSASNSSKSSGEGYTLQASGSGLSVSKSKKVLVPDIPVLFQVWAKYFNYAENGHSKPNNFFVNEEYDHQSIQDKESREKDKNGSLSIPGDLYFFLVVYQDSVQFFTGRKDATGRAHDLINIDFIGTIPENKPYEGGVLNFGEMKEGSCLQVKTIVPGEYFKMSSENTHPPNGEKRTWFICMNEKKDKEFLLELLINMKIQKQHQYGVFATVGKKDNGSTSEPETKSENQTFDQSLLSIEKEINDPNRSPYDGYWKVLQGWSTCTLKCGGGTQTLQLLCVPPKKNGKKCIGESVRTKLCNQQPCPEMQVLNEFVGQEGGSSGTISSLGEKVEKPIVKLMAMSSRPQRYDKCYLKDGDALMETVDRDSGNITNIPVRLVLNNKSLAVFSDDTLQSNIKTFLLETTNFRRVLDNEHCFFIKGLNEELKFCQLDINASAFVDEWGYDFNLFKHQCKQVRKTAEYEEEKLEKEYKEGLGKLQQEMIQKKVLNTKKVVQKTEETELQKKVESTEKLSLDAVQKELKLEEMLEKEEEERQKTEEDELQVQIEQEKKKQECLMKAVNEKKIIDQMNVEKLSADAKMKEIQEKAKREISLNRQKMVKKLSEMRVKKERKKLQLQKQIMSIRLELSNKFRHLSKKGDTNNCKNLDGDSQRDLYCKTHVEAEDQPDCVNAKLKDDAKIFCEYCCEYEFGELHLVERNKCQTEVCKNYESA